MDATTERGTGPVAGHPDDHAETIETAPGRPSGGGRAARDRSRLVGVIVASAATALAGALALYRLDANGFRLDEGVSAIVAGHDLRQVLSWGARAEPNHGLYYLLLHFWMMLGQSEWFVRALSAGLMAGTVPVVFALAERLFGRRAAVLGSFLFGLNAFLIAFAQEARPYALAVFLTTLSSLLFARVVAERSRRRWVWYVLVASLAIHAHLVAAFVVVAHLVSLAFLPRDERPRNEAIVAFGAVGLLSLPLFVFVLRSGFGRISWIEPPTFGSMIQTVSDLMGRGGTATLLAYAGVLCLTAVAIRRAWLTGERWPSAFVVLWLIVPIALGLAISLVEPIVVSRYLIVCVPAIAMLAGIGLAGIRRRSVLVVLACLLTLLGARALVSWYATDSEEWREATAMILEESRLGDAIVFHPGYVVRPVGYYVLRAGGLHAPSPIAPPVVWTPGLPWSGPPEPVQRFLRGSERPARTWLVLSYAKMNAQSSTQTQPLLAQLSAAYPSVTETRFVGLRVLLFS